MNLGVLFSGGKDSVFSAYYFIEQGWNVKCLISLTPMNKDSYMFHTPNISMTKILSKALEIPLISEKTSGEKEKELIDLKKALLKAKKKFNLEGIAVGALASDYQQERVNRICHELNLKTFAPLWHKKPEMLLKEMIDLGFDFRISSVSALGLNEKWLGRKIGLNALNELLELEKKHGLHVAGEGGEFESIVLNGPIFKKRIEVIKAEKKMQNEFTGVYEIKKAVLKSN